MELLKKKMNSIYPLSDETWKELETLLKYKQHPTKYKLNTIGQRATKGYFLIDGFVRTYMISENGKEINRHIYPSGSFIAAFTSLILQKGSHTEIECLTDCKIVEYNYFKFLKILDYRIDLSIMHRKNLEKFYIALEKRELELATLNATDRYLALIKRIPKIDQHVSQKQIAAHLGITSVQLSRITQIKKFTKT